MTPFLLPEERVYRIMARNTGIHFVFDKDDWVKLRDVVVLQIKNRLVTGVGIQIEQYLKIEGKRKTDAPKTDYRRMWYEKSYLILKSTFKIELD